MWQKDRVVAIEEHYWDRELATHFTEAEGTRSAVMRDDLYDFDTKRIERMDAAGVDFAVVSHGAPSAQKLSGPDAAAITRRVNDRLAEAIARHPSRLAGFAALPTAFPLDAADELERCVKQLGFRGAMIHGLTGGLFHDDRRFWPIFERAEALDVPVYLHPSLPHADVSRHYYDDYVREFPIVVRAAWGFTVETATQAIRLVLSRVFASYPRLQFILGHLGEGLPFLLWRIDQALSRRDENAIHFRRDFCEHFHITTSGNFSTPALVCSMLEMGIDRIMFAVDYPFVANAPAMDWIANLQIAPADRSKLLHGNAQRLLKL